MMMMMPMSRTLPCYLRSSSSRYASGSTTRIVSSLFLQRNYQQERKFSSGGITRGYDLLAESLRAGDRRKIILDGFAPTGFDVIHMLHHQEQNDKNSNTGTNNNDDDEDQKEQIVHMNGSILAFPNSCFIWKVHSSKDITVESLSSVILHSPSIEYLFLGIPTKTTNPIPPREFNRIRKHFQSEHNIIVEQLDVVSTVPTT